MYKSIIEVEIIANDTLFNNMSYGLMFHEIKGFESVEIDGTLILSNQKILSSTKLRLVSFKNYQSKYEYKTYKRITNDFFVLN